MDPLSVTLAVISLATALKDLIDTANAIRDSFSKLPQNYKDAKELADSVLETLEELQEIYEDKRSVVEGKKHLKRAIENLLREMKSVHEQCTRLVMPQKERRRDRFKMALYSLWNREKVERLIKDLHEHVAACLSKFVALSTVRTETQVAEINDNLTLSASQTVEIYDFLRNGHGSSLRGSMTGNLCLFSESSSLPMTWIPDAIPTDVISKAYLHREIDRVCVSEESLKRWIPDNPTGINIPPRSWLLRSPPVPDVVIQQNATSLAFRAQSILRDVPTASKIDSINGVLLDLRVELERLKMYKEAILIGRVLVDFWREIQRAHPLNTFKFELAQALTSLGVTFVSMKDRDGACRATKESTQFLQPLLVDDPSSSLSKRCMELLVRNMVIQGGFEEDRDRALQLAADAAKLLWKAFGRGDLQTTSTSQYPPDGWVPADITKLLRIDLLDDDLFTCAGFCVDLANIHSAHSQYEESNKFARMALDMLDNLLSKCPDSNRIQTRMTNVLNVLCKSEMHSLNNPSQNLEYARRNATLFRNLARVNPQNYVIGFAATLWLQHQFLTDLGNTFKARDVYDEIVSLRSLASAPPHLDIKIPSEVEGNYYYYNACYHYDAERYTEAILSLQNAISQYSALEFIEPGRDRKMHIQALALLCQSLEASGQYDSTVSEGFKALRIVDQSNIYNSDPESIENYEEIIWAMLEALSGSVSPAALTQARNIDVGTRIRRLGRSKVGARGKSAIVAMGYIDLLRDGGMVEEALKDCEELRNNWQEIFGASEDDNFLTLGYVLCLYELSIIFSEKGQADQAEQFKKEAADVASKLDTDYMAGVVELLCSENDFAQALQVSQKILSIILEDPATDHNSAEVINALASLADMQLHNYMVDDALRTVQRAIELCQTLGDGQSSSLYRCFRCMCKIYSDLGLMDDAIRCLDDAEKALQNDHKVDSTEDLRDIDEKAYYSILFQRTTLLFSTGAYAQAATLARRVGVYQRNRSKKDKHILKDFAQTLVFSGVLYCTLGRHDEGLAAVTELTEMDNMLQSCWPGLSRNIAVSLDHISKRGWWIPVRNAKNKLECECQRTRIGGDGGRTT